MTRAIILEGPDESGKSTLAKQLLDLTDRSVISIGPHPINRTAVLAFCYQFLVQCSQDVIMDRCTPISELVYREALGGYILEPNELWDILERSHQWAAPVFVFCKPRWINPPQPKQGHDTPEFVQQLRDTFATTIQLYGELATQMSEKGFNVIKYDYFSTTPQQLLEEINKCPQIRS